MRVNGNKLIRNVIDKRVKSRKESKDCIIWEVLPDQKLVRVRIQGSSKDIYAAYPVSWEQTPPWLKAGNIAKITFTGGIRGRIELTGTGHLRPTPYDGTDSMPPSGTSDDDVLSGGLVYPIPLNQRMAVMVATGSYRIGDTVYTLGPKVMGVGDPMLMGDGCPMGNTAAIIDIDSVASGYYRYDLICVGIDGVVDYVKGTAVAAGTEPTLPAVPASHVMLGRVFVYPGLTAITANELTSYYTQPKVAYLTVTSNPTFLDPLDSVSKTLHITATTKDQYGNTVNLVGPLRFSFQLLAGSGTLSVPGESTMEYGEKIYSNVASGSSAYATYVTPALIGETIFAYISVMAELEDQSSSVVGIVQVPVMIEA